jgi:hypothetical protein
MAVGFFDALYVRDKFKPYQGKSSFDAIRGFES